jgi:hypothetical protein
MPHYRFTKYHGTRIDGVGEFDLANDDEALAIGKRLIRDLMRENAEPYAGWALDITEDQRTVGTVLFDGEARARDL